MTLSKKPVSEIRPRIKVVGIGGGGINSVNHMIACGMQGVEFFVVHSDKQALLLSKAQNRIHIGEKLCQGLDAFGSPECGQKAAEEAKDILMEKLSGAEVVFLTVSMGGSTGTGAAPIVARYAKEVGALTIGVATKPFSFEGKRRQNQAEAGIVNLKEYTDVVIIIPDDRLLQAIDRRTSMHDAFLFADDVMRYGVQGISDLLVAPGLINPDFEDVKTIMTNAGSALIGIGTGKGKHGAQAAMETAIKNPLMEASIEDARSVLFNITGGKDLSMIDVMEASKIITEAVDEDAHIIFGAITDNKLDSDEYRVTLVAVNNNEIFDLMDASKRKVCANCKEEYYEGDKYCRYCGAQMGKPDYIGGIMPPLYGPPPINRIHKCVKCGYSWATRRMIDKGRYCPKCGGDAPATISEDDEIPPWMKRP